MIRKLNWTAHAVQRAYERFGGPENVEVPAGRIRRAADCLGLIGARFSVRTKKVTFVCVVGEQLTVAIKTLFRTNRGNSGCRDNRELRKQKRQSRFAARTTRNWKAFDGN